GHGPDQELHNGMGRADADCRVRRRLRDVADRPVLHGPGLRRRPVSAVEGGIMLWNCLEATIFGTVDGRIVAALLAGRLAVQGWLHLYHDPRVQAEVPTEINARAGRLAQEAEAARAPAQKPGAFERLLKTSCRDC